MSYRIHQFEAIFEPWHLSNALLMWADLLDLQQQFWAQHLVRNIMIKLFSFLSYLKLEFLEKICDRQAWCEFHNLNKWSVKYLYYKIVSIQNVIIFQYCPGEK